MWQFIAGFVIGMGFGTAIIAWLETEAIKHGTSIIAQLMQHI